jgi:hypothetical protein
MEAHCDEGLAIHIRPQPCALARLARESEADLFDRLRSAESICRPLGSDRLLAQAQRLTGRALKPRITVSSALTNRSLI